MTHPRTLGSLVATMFLIVFPARGAIGATAPGPKCQATKLAAAGKEAADELVCHAKATKKGVAVDSACITKAQGRLEATFMKTDATEGCTTTGDGPIIDRAVSSFVEEVVTALRPTPGPSVCAAAKLIATDKKSAALAKAYARNATKPDAGKLAAVHAKVAGAFAHAFTKAETHKHCQTTGDMTTVGDDVDAFAKGAVATLRVSAGIVFKDFNVSAGLPVPVVLNGSFQSSAAGPVGQVVATYGSGGTATLMGGPGTFTVAVGDGVVDLLPADPTSVTVNGASVSINSALGALLTDIQSGADPSHWSLAGQALLAIGAISSSDAWVQGATAAATAGAGASGSMLSPSSNARAALPEHTAEQSTSSTSAWCKLTVLVVLTRFPEPHRLA